MLIEILSAPRFSTLSAIFNDLIPPATQKGIFISLATNSTHLVLTTSFFVLAEIS